MNNKIFTGLCLAALLFSVSFGQGLENPGESGSQTRVFGDVSIDTTTERGQTMSEIVTRQQERLDGSGSQEGVRTRTTNSYKAGAYLQGLMETAELAGGSAGSRITETARNMNQSLSAMVASEEQMRSRNVFMKFLFGADKEAVSDTEQKLNQTQDRLRELEGEVAQIEDAQVKEMAQEQIRYIKQEIEMLQTQVQKEKQSKGIFGFLFGA